jgi:hypothetical protein
VYTIKLEKIGGKKDDKKGEKKKQDTRRLLPDASRLDDVWR